MQTQNRCDYRITPWTIEVFMVFIDIFFIVDSDVCRGKVRDIAVIAGQGQGINSDGGGGTCRGRQIYFATDTITKHAENASHIPYRSYDCTRSVVPTHGTNICAHWWWKALSAMCNYNAVAIDLLFNELLFFWEF